MKVYTPDNMRAADKYTIENLNVPGTHLMDRAAQTLFCELEPHLGKTKKFVILCGKGNNGGDGFALAKKLSESFENAVCISVFGKPTTNDALHFYNLCENLSTPDCKVTLIDAEENPDIAIQETETADVIVDAIFGTGFDGEISENSLCARLIELANSTSAFRLSADIPSGANAFSGAVSKIVFCADTTVTFAKGKIGMFSYPARDYCGKIIISDIGIPESVFKSFDSKYEVTDDAAVRHYLPKRYANSNKGSYGKLLVVAGSTDMTGATHLALSGALRFGAGLVAFASTPYVTNVIKHRLSEPVFLSLSDSEQDTDKLIEYSKSCSAVLIGCGLGSGTKTKDKVIRLIKECDCPIILDADGINTIVPNINVITEAKKGILLTPHPLEFSRIAGKPLSHILSNRLECAVEFSKAYGCTVLLKGAGTLICGKDGRVCINPIACSALSKGGSGDVLAGMIASFAAQGASLYESAVCGAYLHAMAGKELSLELSEYGVLPSDIPMCAAKILSRLI